MSVLLLDGEQRSTLAATRALGKARIKVTVGGENIPCLASSSRFCHRTFKYTSPLESPPAFLRDLRKELSDEDYELIIPMTDVTTILISENRDIVPDHCKIPLPERKAVNKAMDKGEVCALAASKNIPIPKTYVIQKKTDLEMVAKTAKFPVVVKPRFSRSWTGKGWISGATSYVHEPAELVNLYDGWPHDLPFPLLQERIHGPGCGVFLLIVDGVTKAIFFHKRLREKPPSGGVSVLRESIAPEPDLQMYAQQILEALGWKGVAMVEFKIDLRDGRPRLMEINPRFWGSLQLAIDSGVNFPLLLYRSQMGMDIDPVSQYRIGVKSRWFIGDLDSLMTLCVKTKRRLNLPASSKSRLRTILDFFFISPLVSKNEVLRVEDVKPGIFEIKQYVRDLLGEVEKRLKRKGTDDNGLPKGALHIHTTYSHDGEMSAEEVALFFQEKGYSFVLLTEHSQDLNPQKVSELKDQCRSYSKANFNMIPGIEFACQQDLHILGIGVAELTKSVDPVEVVGHIHKNGGVAVWAHPLKHGKPLPLGLVKQLDGVEIWNLGNEGRFFPHIAALRLYLRLQKESPKLKCFVGIDFHRPKYFYPVHLRLNNKKNSISEILLALKSGAFTIQSSLFRIGSVPRIGIAFYILMLTVSCLLNFLRTIKRTIIG